MNPNPPTAVPDTAPQPPGDRALRVRAEQIRSVYLQSPTTTVGSLVAGAALALFMLGKLSPWIVLGWFGVLCLHQAVRVYDYFAWRRANPGPEEARRWGRRYVAAAFSAGCIWGAAGVLLFVPDSIAHQALLSLILFGITGVSMGGLSPFAPAFFTLIPLVLVPFILRILWSGEAESVALAVPGIIVLAVALMFGRNVNRIVRESIEKGFENLELVEALSRQTSVAEEARAQAEAANRAKTQFFAAASHDLRQPLHALGLFASALTEKTKEPDVLNVVHSINTSVGALEGLFNELLDISKIDAGTIKPRPEHFPLQRLLDRMELDFQPEAFEKGLRLCIRPCRAYVHTDPLLLERILRNLITNAVRYTREGGVVVGCRRRGRAVSVEVWDTGIGIPEDKQELVFEEFYQLANPERSSKKGLGLGLSIVRRLAQLLDCPLETRSVPGRGSVFRIRVPLGERSAMESRPARAQERAPGSLDGVLVVVVDDEEAIVEGMRVLLTGWGAEVVGCATGQEAAARLEAAGQAPDLAIVDFRLQNDRTGVDVIRDLRARYGADLPAILVTGSTAPEHVEDARANDLHLLLKPVMPAKLRTLINFKLQQKLSLPGSTRG